ncbi:MAG: BtpA/SgcQ family protein [FCB group bacterium]|nr:BtpA/SgcQ family protein [FCB group bacterium]
MQTSTFKSLFNINKPVIGMIHLLSLPGTPGNDKSVDQIIDTACREAERYHSAGVDAVMIENMHDRPYLKRTVGPEIVSAMSVIAKEVKRVSGLPCGVQVLAGANLAALAVANAANLEFVRVEGFVFAHVADEGLIESDAGALLRYRKQIHAEKILIFTDIKKKHSAHAISADVSPAETARAAEFFLSDGVIITGSATGKATDLKDVKDVHAAVGIPVLIGSGITASNVETYLPWSDALIVGSHFKKDGAWVNPVDYDRVVRFMEIINNWRNKNE